VTPYLLLLWPALDFPLSAHAVGKLDWSEIQGCVVDILSAKNDKQHKGNRLYFGIADMTDPNQAYCIVETL